MLLCKFISKQNRKLGSINTKADINNDKDNLLYLESQLALNEFQQLVRYFKHNEELGHYYSLELEGNVDPIKAFLKKRYQRIRDTPAMYEQAQTPANQLCIYLATSLATAISETKESLLAPQLTIGAKSAKSIAVPEDDGWGRIRSSLCGDIHHREQLVNAMLKYPMEAREKFLNLFSLEDLTRYVLEGETYKNAVKNKNAYTGDEAHDGAVLLLFTIFYRKQLELRDYENAGLFGWNWGKGYSRKEKLDASFIPYNFLMEGGKLADFEGYMKKINFVELRGALTQTESDLGTLANQFLLVTTPEYRKIELNLAPRI